MERKGIEVDGEVLSSNGEAGWRAVKKCKGIAPSRMPMICTEE